MQDPKANKSQPPTDPSALDESFCSYPFSQLLLQPTGEVSPCCFIQEYSLGKAPDQAIEEIWNAEPIRRLRREFIEGKPVSCRTQMRHIRCHHDSQKLVGKAELELKEIQSRPPIRFDVRLNGSCNLQCVMCGVWKQPNGLYDRSDFWSWGAKDVFPYLEQLDVLGGEPFVQRDTFRLIDEVSAVNPKCTWAFVTNGHYKFGESITKRLDKILVRSIQVSLDSVDPEVYASIRKGGTLPRVLQTIEDLITYRANTILSGKPAFRLSLSMCVQRKNWEGIRAFADFARSKHMDPVFLFAYTPESESILNLSSADRSRAIREIEELGEELSPEFVHRILAPLKDAMETGR